MEDKAIKKHEHRGYSRGYAAGMRRRQHELDLLQVQLNGDKNARRERIFCAVINGLLASGNTSNWTMGDEKINNTKTYNQLARRFVDEAMRKMNF